MLRGDAHYRSPKLVRELYDTYKADAAAGRDSSSHAFVVRHCFLRAPTPDTQAYADEEFSNFNLANAIERRNMIAREGALRPGMDRRHFLAEDG